MKIENGVAYFTEEEKKKMEELAKDLPVYNNTNSKFNPRPQMSVKERQEWWAKFSNMPFGIK